MMNFVKSFRPILILRFLAVLTYPEVAALQLIDFCKYFNFNEVCQLFCESTMILSWLLRVLSNSVILILLDFDILKHSLTSTLISTRFCICSNARTQLVSVLSFRPLPDPIYKGLNSITWSLGLRHRDLYWVPCDTHWLGIRSLRDVWSRNQHTI